MSVSGARLKRLEEVNKIFNQAHMKSEEKALRDN